MMTKPNSHKHFQDLIKRKQFDKAIQMITNLIEKDHENIELLLQRASLYKQMQKLSDALNDYIRVLKINPADGKAQAGKEMISDIIRFKSLDIYSSTNLNNDPWLD